MKHRGSKKNCLEMFLQVRKIAITNFGCYFFYWRGLLCTCKISIYQSTVVCTLMCNPQKNHKKKNVPAKKFSPQQLRHEGSVLVWESTLHQVLNFSLYSVGGDVMSSLKSFMVKFMIHMFCYVISSRRDGRTWRLWIEKRRATWSSTR